MAASTADSRRAGVHRFETLRRGDAFGIGVPAGGDDLGEDGLGLGRRELAVDLEPG